MGISQHFAAILLAVWALGTALVSAGDCRVVAWTLITAASGGRNQQVSQTKYTGMYPCRDDGRYFDKSPERSMLDQFRCNDNRWTFTLGPDGSRIDFYHSGGGRYDMYWSGGTGRRIGHCWPSCSERRATDVVFGAAGSYKALQCDVWWTQ